MNNETLGEAQADTSIISEVSEMCFICNAIQEQERIIMKTSDRIEHLGGFLQKSAINIIIAEAGVGKTMIASHNIVEAVNNNDATVALYIDSDSSPIDLKLKHKYFKEKAGDKIILMSLDVFTNSHKEHNKPMKILRNIRSELDKLSIFRDKHIIIVIDVMKDFFFVNDKKQAVEAFSIFNDIVTQDMTLLIIGHTNKRKDQAGKLVQEGTSEIIQKAHNLYMLKVDKSFDDDTDTHKSVVVDLELSKLRIPKRFVPYKINVKRYGSEKYDSEYKIEVRFEDRPNKLKDSAKRIINCLKESGRMSLQEIADKLKVDKSNISRECAELERLGELKGEKVGKVKFYEIADKSFKGFKLDKSKAMKQQSRSA